MIYEAAVGTDVDSMQIAPRRARATGTAAERDRLLQSYLRDVRTATPMERDVEARQARELADARQAFQRVVLSLPLRYRASVVDGQADPDERWRLPEIEAIHDRLLSRLGDVTDPEVAQAVRQATRDKGRIDETRNALVLGSLRFVAHIAKRMSSDSMAYLDLIQEGNLGLMEAVERFEHERGHRFSTYAFWWIRRAMSEAAAGKSRVIYVPYEARKRLAELNRMVRELTEEMGHAPSPEELAQAMDLSPKKVKELMSLGREPLPLQGANDDSGVDRINSVPDSEGLDPLEQTMSREALKQVGTALACLKPRERAIIKLRFGIGRATQLTLKEVGRLLSLSRERVRQIERMALRKMLVEIEGN